MEKMDADAIAEACAVKTKEVRKTETESIPKKYVSKAEEIID